MKNKLRYFKKSYSLYLMLLFPVLYFIIFKFLPMRGVVLAFKEYNMFGDGMFAGKWVGFDHFKEAFSAIEFQHAFKNTLILNLGDLIIGFPLPIIAAVALNELVSTKLRKTTQVILFLPYFLSMVIVAGISYQIFSNTGIINSVFSSIGLHKIGFLSDSFKWRFVYWGMGIWQSLGYNLIIYVAALMGIDSSLFEAAYIDGATRLQRIIHITLPMIGQTISIMFIMAIGGIVGISFERPFLMGNALVTNASSVISTYTYNVGIAAGRFDYATAIGLFQSVVGIIFLLIANKIANKFGEGGLF